MLLASQVLASASWPTNLSYSLGSMNNLNNGDKQANGELEMLRSAICGDHELHWLPGDHQQSSSISHQAFFGSKLSYHQHQHNHNHHHNHDHDHDYEPTSSLQVDVKQNNYFSIQIDGQPEPLSKIVLSNLMEPLQEIDSKLDYYFNEFWSNGADERASKLPFMSGGPWKLIYATLIYLYLIKWLLPKFMRDKQAMELNWLIRCYNLLMVLSNMYAFYHGARILSFGIKCFGCEIINHEDYSPIGIELLHYGWLFFLSRLIEWLDTIFFVLRKKEKQVTKLHVFHHSFVPLISWVYLKYHPGYTVAFFPLVNTFVHTIMYTYYLLATFGPSMQAYLWWKKYLTSLQIAQFVLILIQLASIPLSSNEKCQYPKGFFYAACAGAILFLWLFFTYYIDTYKVRQPTNYSNTGKQPSQDQQQKATDSNGMEKNEANQQREEDAINKKNNERSSLSSYWYQYLSSNKREGSSKSLSDAIENAIASEASSGDLISTFNAATGKPRASLLRKRLD